MSVTTVHSLYFYASFVEIMLI